MFANASSPLVKRTSAVSVRPLDARSFGPRPKPVLSRGDLRAMRFAFGFAAGLVLTAAISADGCLLASICRMPSSFEDASARQLATDLLPWALAFTALAGSATWFGLAMFRRMADETADQPVLRRRLISEPRMRLDAFSPG